MSRTGGRGRALCRSRRAPLWIPGDYYVNIVSQILIYAVFALGLNVLVGYAGLVSLGHAGLFGVASYAVAWLVARFRPAPGGALRARRDHGPRRGSRCCRCAPPGSASS